MTGVDPRIPIKPHESEYRGPPRPRGGERRSRRAGRGGGGGGRGGGRKGGPPGADLLTPANSLQ